MRYFGSVFHTLWIWSLDNSDIIRLISQEINLHDRIILCCAKKNCVLHKRLKVEKEKTIWLLMLNKATIYSLCEKKHQNFGINNNQHLSKFLGLQKTLWSKTTRKVSWINLNFSCLKWSLWILAPKCQHLFEFSRQKWNIVLASIVICFWRENSNISNSKSHDNSKR